MAEFDKVKDAVSIEQAAQMLGLQLKKEPTGLRCECPVHAGGNRTLAITPTRALFFCFPSKKGGSCIDLVAHVREVATHEAANMLAKHFGLDSSRTSPQARAEKETATPPARGMAALDYLDPLAEQVEALGITPAVADQVGIGFASRGTMTGRVLFPIRMPDGTLIGYCGIALDADPPFLFPSNLEERAEGKVVQLRRKC